MIRIKNKMFTAKGAEKRKERKYFIAGWFLLLDVSAKSKKEKNLCALCVSVVKNSSAVTDTTPPEPDDPGKKN
jgi:hypothetical protein